MNRTFITWSPDLQLMYIPFQPNIDWFDTDKVFFSFVMRNFTQTNTSLSWSACSLFTLYVVVLAMYMHQPDVEAPIYNSIHYSSFLFWDHSTLKYRSINFVRATIGYEIKSLNNSKLPTPTKLSLLCGITVFHSHFCQIFTDFTEWITTGTYITAYCPRMTDAIVNHAASMFASHLTTSQSDEFFVEPICLILCIIVWLVWTG